MDATLNYAQLADGAEISLASWLAEPMSPASAAAALDEVQGRLHRARGNRFALNLAALICRYWAGRDISAVYQTMSALAAAPREAALLELCCGQLFMARRSHPAWEHLDRGFRLATHLLAAEDYFCVLKRHELLRQLPLHRQPAAPAGLAALLQEARVVARLQRPGRAVAPGTGGHRDTLD